MIEYQVKVYNNGDRFWYLGDMLHREDGPAIEWVTGDRFWYLNGQKMTEAEFNARSKVESCDGKVVEIDGKRYTLTLVE
jgi:hypothetical protein